MGRYYRRTVGFLVAVVAFAGFLLLFRGGYYLVSGSLPPDGAIAIGLDVLAVWAAIGVGFWFDAYRARTLAMSSQSPRSPTLDHRTEPLRKKSEPGTSLEE